MDAFRQKEHTLPIREGMYSHTNKSNPIMIRRERSNEDQRSSGWATQ